MDSTQIHEEDYSAERSCVKERDSGCDISASTSKIRCASSQKKSVHFAPSERNAFYADTLTLEERSMLWSTSNDFQRYERDALESVNNYRNCLRFSVDGSFVDTSKHCVRGLEEYYEINIVKKTEVIDYYVDCILELQDDLLDIEEGSPGMDPKRRRNLLNAINRLDVRQAAKARKRASEDRRAANQIFQEGSLVQMIHENTATALSEASRRQKRLSFSEKVRPNVAPARMA